MKVKDILAVKGPEVLTIGRQKSLKIAIETMANNKIGALLVIDADGKISGILSERDVVRYVAKELCDLAEVKVEDAMTDKVIVVESEDSIEYVESIMTENRIRHLPVVNEQLLVGLISIGDVVKCHIDTVEIENKYLRDYIEGNFK